jgi:hypothetical protein
MGTVTPDRLQLIKCRCGLIAGGAGTDKTDPAKRSYVLPLSTHSRGQLITARGRQFEHTRLDESLALARHSAVAPQLPALHYRGIFSEPSNVQLAVGTCRQGPKKISFWVPVLGAIFGTRFGDLPFDFDSKGPKNGHQNGSQNGDPKLGQKPGPGGDQRQSFLELPCGLQCFCCCQKSGTCFSSWPCCSQCSCPCR